MSYHHQPQLSVNSIQSLVEPVTPPPLGQMSNKKNHTKTQSLDLSEFNQFMQNPSPMMMMKTFSPPEYQNANQGTSPRGALPLINEFDVGFDAGSRACMPGIAATPGAVAGVVPTPSIPSVNTNTNSSTSSSLRTASGTETMEITSTPLEELDYVKLATDQFGCRFLQKKLESPTESNLVRDLMYEQIKGCFLDLILDSFGNYLIQKLCEYLTFDQKTFLIQLIYPHVFQISINQYGTRSLQKIIDTVDNESQIDLIIRGFSQEHTSIEQVVTLINDLNGNHVIQKCIFKFPPSKFDFIIDAIVEHNNIIKISTHKHGCCVLQKALSVCTLQQIFKISVKIVQFLPGLINDQFGNYIIQFLLDIKELDFYLLAEIFNRLSNELCQLSCLKFSSNVVEKFIKKLFGIIMDSVPKGQETLIPEPNDDVVTAAMGIALTIIDIFTVNLNVLIRDNFGNYALQTLADVKNYGSILEYPGNSFVLKSVKLLNFSHDFTTKIGNLVILTKEFLPSIKTTSYAKKIKLKVKAYAELTGIAFADLSPKKNSGNTGNGHFNNNHNNNNNNNNHNNHFNNLRNHGNGNNGKFNHHKNEVGYPRHSRHFSLPANAFHKRNSSSASSFGVLPQAQSLQLPPTPMGNSNAIYGHNQFLAPPTTTATISNSAAASGGNYPAGPPPPQFVPTTATQIPPSQNQSFIPAALPKPNSNPNLQALQRPAGMPFTNDMGSSTNSSRSSLFQNTMNDPFAGKNFAFAGGSQSSLCEPSFTQQRVMSNPFPLQPISQHPPVQQTQFMNNYVPIRAVDSGMYMGANGSNPNNFVNSSNDFNFGFR